MTIESRVWNFQGVARSKSHAFLCRGTLAKKHFRRFSRNFIRGSSLRGYFTLTDSPGGLPHELGLHFHPRGSGRLSELEFFRTSYSDLTTSYKEFQRHLEITFGSPTVTTPGSEGFPSHAWRIPGVEVVRFVLDRFGPEEHVRIKRRASEQT